MKGNISRLTRQHVLKLILYYIKYIEYDSRVTQKQDSG